MDVTIEIADGKNAGHLLSSRNDAADSGIARRREPSARIVQTSGASTASSPGQR
jgi:hypothetical protein